MAVACCRFAKNIKGIEFTVFAWLRVVKILLKSCRYALGFLFTADAERKEAWLEFSRLAWAVEFNFSLAVDSPRRSAKGLGGRSRLMLIDSSAL